MKRRHCWSSVRCGAFLYFCIFWCKIPSQFLSVSSFYKCHILFHSGLPITNKMKQITAENIRKCLLISSQAIISCSKQNKWKYKADVRLSKKLRWIRSRKKTKNLQFDQQTSCSRVSYCPSLTPEDGSDWLRSLLQCSKVTQQVLIYCTQEGCCPPPPRLFH